MPIRPTSMTLNKRRLGLRKGTGEVSQKGMLGLHERKGGANLIFIWGRDTARPSNSRKGCLTSPLNHQGLTSMPEDGITFERIRDRAYDIWDRNHRPEGYDVEIWLMAERELSAEAAVATPTQADADSEDISLQSS